MWDCVTSSSQSSSTSEALLKTCEPLSTVDEDHWDTWKRDGPATAEPVWSPWSAADDEWSTPSESIGLHDPKSLICGRHSRIPGFPQELRYPRILAPREKPGSCICDYTDFPILLKERLRAKCPLMNVNRTGIAAPKSIKQFPFFDLPYDIRLLCYEEMLTMSHDVEFCPEPWFFQGTAPIGRAGRKRFDEGWDPIHEHHMVTIKALSKAAGLLRTCKLVNSEAKALLYRNNRFSFTNTSGWIGLDWFLSRIGPENCRQLRHIVVRHPDFLSLPITLNGSNHFDNSILQLSSPPPGQSSTPYPSRWFERPPSMNPFWIMRDIRLLRSLTIVFPYLDFTDRSETTKTFVARLMERRPYLRTTLLSLRSENDEAEGDVQSVAKRIFADMEGHQSPSSGRLRFRETTYNSVGDYEL